MMMINEIERLTREIEIYLNPRIGETERAKHIRLMLLDSMTGRLEKLVYREARDLPRQVKNITYMKPLAAARKARKQIPNAGGVAS
jgi:hypothetical protein